MTPAGPAAGGRRELVHPRTRTAFREACSDWGVLRQISRAFDDEGVEPMSESDFWMAGHSAGVLRGGQRRALFDRYTRRIDWTDPVQVRPVLRVFEQVLTWAGEDHAGRARLVGVLERDGLRVDERGRIRDAAGVMAELPLEHLRDPAAIREHLDRIAEASDRDPPLAISGARALVEATAKLVLHELGEPVDERADVPALVKQAQKALGLHRDVVAPDAKGADAIKRIFSALSQLAVGVAELRSLYGSDHGRSTATATGLGARHAHLAVGAANVYCRTLLETLEAHAARPSGGAST